MRVRIVRDYEELSSVAAKIVIDLVSRKHDAVLTLPAGGTPIGMYRKLVEAYERGMVDFSGIRLFDIDTVLAPRSDPHSHYSYIVKHFASGTNLRRDNWFVLEPSPTDTEAFCREYDLQVARLGGIDLVMDGLGHNGHFGYNEPGCSFSSVTGEVTIAERTRQANARWYASADQVPTKGLTMGISTIMQAREIVILVSGRDKAQIVRRVCEGPVTEEVPMTVIRRHPASLMVIDEDAAHLLTPDALRRINAGQGFTG